MRILLHGSAIHSPTGYSVQTALFAPRLQALGHDVAVACWFGFAGGALGNPAIPGPREPIPLYPQGYTEYSFDALPSYYRHFNADLCVSIIDAWVCSPEEFTSGERWVPLFPVDCEPLPLGVRVKAEQGVDRFVISRFGERVCAEAGLSSTYVPAAFHPAYTPDGPSLREGAGWADKYVVGVVAANKGWPSRKNWPQIFEGFALFADEVPEAQMHVHSSVGREFGGLDLDQLATEAGVSDRVSWNNPLDVHLGIPHAAMAQFYRAFDVLLNPAMGEGFCVPLVEAQACGTPVVAGDWTAMSEVSKTGVLIPKEKALRWNWTNNTVTNQWIPPAESVAEALMIAYKKSRAGEWPTPEETSARVAEYAADRVVAEHWAPALERLDRVKQSTGPNRASRRKAKIKSGKVTAR